MSPSEALALLDQLVSQIPLARADHARVSKAVQTLSELVLKEKANGNSQP